MATLRDDLKAEREKMKGRPLKDKLEYFWEYYKFHAIGIIVGLLIVIYIVKTIVTAKDYALFVVEINSGDATGEVSETWKNELTDFLDVDTKDYEVYIDSSMQFSFGNVSSQTDYTSAQKLTALLTARTMDIMMSDITVFEQYAQNRCFIDLREIYTEDELAAMEGRIYYTDAATYSDYDSSELNVYEIQSGYVIDHHDPSSMEDPIPVGIFADENTRVGQSGVYDYLADTGDYQGHENEAVIGIIASTERRDAAVMGLQYFLNE